jgi:hypothetical protein
VYIELRVKLERVWRNDPQQVRELDWRHELEQMGGE